MSDVSFYGTVDKWTLGEPPRLEIVSRKNDNAVAQSLALLKQRILSVSVYEGAKDDEFCTLTATLPPIQTSIGKSGDGTRVKLDVDPKQLPVILRLLAVADKALRFAFADEGTQPGKPKRETKPKPPKGEHGKFWQQLYDFHNRPDVRAWLEYFDSDESEAKRRLCEKFGVTSRTFISPDDLINGLKSANASGYLNGAITIAERAKAAMEAA